MKSEIRNPKSEINSRLTDRNFWVSFWESKKDLIFDVKRDYVFGEIIGKLAEENNVKTAIELGGFPGSYSVYLKKYYQIDTTLFDYFIHPGIVKDLLLKNSLHEGDIAVVEADLFNYVPEKQFDMVMSFGLIEHFKDIKDIIKRHLNFLKPGGVLFIVVPNFRAVNGWVQKTFDRENYNKHNIDSMDPRFLAEIAAGLGLKSIKSYHYGKFSLWLENREQKPALTKIFTKLIWYGGKAIVKLFPFESRTLSPYIILQAKR